MPRGAVTIPLVPNVVSRLPSVALYLTRVKTLLLPLLDCPAATISPSDWMPRALACESLLPTDVVTMPPVPNVVSGLPSVLYLTRVITLLLPLLDCPAATILPSDWMPRALAPASLLPTDVVTLPPVPNVVSGLPSVALYL